MLKKSFLDYLKFERNYSEHTITSYARDLDDFSVWLNENPGIVLFEEKGAGQVHHRMIRSWMAGLHARKLAKRTIARKLAAINSYFRFLMKSGLLKANPAARVSAPKADKKLPSWVNETDMDRLFNEIEYDDDWQGSRDKCLLEVLYNCGLRRSELIGLKFSNISFSDRTIRVLGKGNKERIVPFGNHAASAMKDYMKKSDEIHLNYRDSFFVNTKGKPLNPRSVYRVVNKYLNLICSLTQKSPHVLRHTFATHLLNRGADLNAIKELLGHQSLAATQVYVHNSIGKLKQVYTQAHPKA